MKRLLAFLVGLILTLGLLYFIRQWLAGQAVPVEIAAPTPSTEPKADTPRPAGRFTVRTTGPRPQSPLANTVTTESSIVGESEDRHREPSAATNTTEAASTPRAEMTEPTILDDLPVKTLGNTSDDSSETDFTLITDIGPVFNKKLLDAGIKTFGDLAALSPAEIEEKTAIPATRIERGEWIKQAARLAEGLSLPE